MLQSDAWKVIWVVKRYAQNCCTITKLSFFLLSQVHLCPTSHCTAQSLLKGSPLQVPLCYPLRYYCLPPLPPLPSLPSLPPPPPNPLPPPPLPTATQLSWPVSKQLSGGNTKVPGIAKGAGQLEGPTLQPIRRQQWGQVTVTWLQPVDWSIDSHTE